MKIILLILLITLILRLFLSNLGFHVDILSIAGWGKWIYENGLKGFYENEVWIYSWPTQLPLANILYWLDYELYKKIGDLFVLISSTIANYRLAPTKFLWWFDFVKWFGGSLYKPTWFLVGYLKTIKFIAILSDLALATIIYFLAKRIDKNRAILLSGFYLFAPFSIYLSAIWGQYDQLTILLFFLSMIFLLKRWLYLAPVVLAISIGIKPTTLIFIPLFLWLYFKQNPSIKHILVGSVSVVVIFLYSTYLFTDNNIFEFIRRDLIKIVFQKAEFRVSTHSYNFWHILIGNRALPQDYPFLFIPAKIWGYAAFLYLNILAFKTLKKVSMENMFKAMFLIGAGGWLFLTNMLERYFFAGILSLLLLCIYQPKLLKYWVVLSLIYWINLYDSFWFPEIFNPLKEILIWQDGLVTRFLSLINIAIFIRVIMLIKPSLNWRLFK